MTAHKEEKHEKVETREEVIDPPSGASDLLRVEYERLAQLIVDKVPESQLRFQALVDLQDSKNGVLQGLVGFEVE